MNYVERAKLDGMLRILHSIDELERLGGIPSKLGTYRCDIQLMLDDLVFSCIDTRKACDYVRLRYPAYTPRPRTQAAYFSANGKSLKFGPTG